VLVVARLALLALDRRRGVEALPGPDPPGELVVVVAAQALVVRQLLGLADVAVVAAVLGVERGVARRERAGRAAWSLPIAAGVCLL